MIQTNVMNILAKSREQITKSIHHEKPQQGLKKRHPHLENNPLSMSILTKGLLGVKMVLMGVLPPPLLPLLGGLILFSFCRRLQNQTRITSFSMLSWSAIMVISSEVGFWFCLKRAKEPGIPCEY